MNEIVLGGIVVFFALLLIGRRIGDRNSKAMACSERERLVDTFARLRMVHIVPLVFIMIWYFAGTRFIGVGGDTVLHSVYCLLCLYMAAVNGIVYMRLRREGYSREYLRGFLISRALTFAGLVVLIASLLIGGR